MKRTYLVPVVRRAHELGWVRVTVDRYEDDLDVEENRAFNAATDRLLAGEFNLEDVETIPADGSTWQTDWERQAEFQSEQEE